MAEITAQRIEEDLRAIIAEIIEVEPEKITSEAKFVEDLGMDSMMALEILVAIEKKYKVQIPEEKLNKLRTLKEAAQLTKDYVER